MTKAHDFPFDEVKKSCERITREGGYILQKWTCGRCGARIRSATLNQFCHFGHHDDTTCDHVTDLRVAGCNFMAVLTPERDAAKVAAALGVAPPPDMGPAQGGVQ